ncbi:MAG: potassium channel protein [Myxococcales bacterium]|nr:potassium channel protein [Myxococcales bacterium]
MQELRTRLAAASLAILLVVGMGALGFYVIGEGRWEPFDCLYMTVITLTTVGFSEVLPGFEETQYARHFTMILIVTGVGTFLYFVSTLTAMIIEGDLQRAFKETRMHKTIDKLKEHIIVCGVGSTGRHVLKELAEYGIQTVLIDIDPDAIAFHRETYPQAMCLLGDATDDDVLAKANIKSARGIVAAMANDKENLYLTISAREANPDVRIVARGSDLRVLEKLRKAGADTVVSPNYIGGLRMVSELLRPKVVRFLDEMRRDRSKTRIEEVDIPQGSSFAGRSLLDMDFRNITDLLVLAVRVPESGYQYNPNADFVLESGMTLVVLGPISQVYDLRKQARVD